jgi:cell division protein FtsL
MLDSLPPDAKVFKYKLDFYYVQTIFYLVALVLWAGFRGTFSLPKLPPMQSDPILYIILTFVITSLITVLLNKFRERRLIIMQDKMIFHRKGFEREVMLHDIEWMYIGKERRVQTAGRFQVVLFKLKDRLRLIRIRIGRYEHEDELLTEMERIAEIVPKIKRPMQMLRTPRMAQQIFS